jgi:hypothetical protein
VAQQTVFFDLFFKCYRLNYKRSDERRNYAFTGLLSSTINILTTRIHHNFLKIAEINRSCMYRALGKRWRPSIVLLFLSVN